MKTLRIREENPAAWYSNNVRQPVITPNALSQSIKYPSGMPCKSTHILIHHFTSSPPLQKRKPQSHGGQRQATHQGGQHSIKEAHHSRVSFLLICFLPSFAILCLPLLVSSSLDLLPEEILKTEGTPEYISSDSSLEEEDATPEQRINHQLRRHIRHLEHDLRDITVRCHAERERHMSLEVLVGGKTPIFI
jgi:hypothetical protein